MVPTDGSQYSIKAAEYAAEISKKFGAEVHLLNVISPSLIRGIRRKEKKSSQEAPKKTRKVFDGMGVNVILRKPIRGHPADTICDIVEKEKFDLIIMGNRGVSGVKAFLLGGVTDSVSNHAVCPVLIVR